MDVAAAGTAATQITAREVVGQLDFEYIAPAGLALVTHTDSRGARCIVESAHYRWVTADFLRHVLAGQRGPAFALQVTELRQQFYQGIVGE